MGAGQIGDGLDGELLEFLEGLATLPQLLPILLSINLDNRLIPLQAFLRVDLRHSLNLLTKPLLGKRNKQMELNAIKEKRPLANRLEESVQSFEALFNEGFVGVALHTDVSWWKGRLPLLSFRAERGCRSQAISEPVGS